jgi:membrane-associated phospholipid phosphatase
MRARDLSLALLASSVLVAACGETATNPSDTAAGRSSTPATASATGTPKFWEANAAADWTDLATSLAARRPIDAGRMYAYLSLAQFRAAEAAEAVRPHPPTAGAIGAASATVLASFFPADAAEIEAALDAQAAATPWPGAKHQDFAAGEALGRSIGSQVLVYAQGDRVGLANPGLPPVGDGYWIAGAVVARGNYKARPFFLASDDEFLPPPPPAFGSQAFLDGLAEVKSIASNRTAEQVAIANYWNVNQSPRSNAAVVNLAVELIRSHRVKETRAARILFLMNAASFDAIIGCFGAKYAYWFIRPPQADPTITTVFPTPPHPSYPSAHSCVSGATTGVLALEFPDEATRLEGVAIEASLSRLYAGIHYRFDMEAGLALGRAVAAKAVASDLDAVAVLP